MAEKNLLQLIEETLTGDEAELPSLDRVAQTVFNLAQQEETTIPDLVAVIEQDAAMSSRILRMANSPFYAGLSQARTLKDAAIRLGVSRINQFAIQAVQASLYSQAPERYKPIYREVWQHHLLVAEGSRKLAELLDLKELRDEAYTAGLLHDIGKLAILHALGRLEENASLEQPSMDLVNELLDSLHPEQGARLLEHWSVPEPYISVARQHHAPYDEQLSTLQLLVRTVNKLMDGPRLKAELVVHDLMVLEEIHALQM